LVFLWPDWKQRQIAEVSIVGDEYAAVFEGEGEGVVKLCGGLGAPRARKFVKVSVTLGGVRGKREQLGDSLVQANALSISGGRLRSEIVVANVSSRMHRYDPKDVAVWAKISLMTSLDVVCDRMRLVYS
jgi:hypothetical protein